MTEKKKAEEKVEVLSLESVNKKLNDLEAKVRTHTENWKRFVSKYVSSLSNGEVGSIRWALAFLLVVGVAGGVYAASQWALQKPSNTAVNTVDVDSAGTLTITGDADTDAKIILDADLGDDTADMWTIEAEASGNDLSIMNGVTEVLNLTSAGNLQVDGTLTASGLLDSDTTAVTGDFAVGTNLTVGGTAGITGAATFDSTVGVTGAFTAGVQATTEVSATNAITIGASYYGKLVIVATNAAFAVTLPSIPAAGTWFEIMVKSTATDACAPTITGGSSIITGPNDVDHASVTWGSGERLGAKAKFQSDGTYWHVDNLGGTTMTYTD